VPKTHRFAIAATEVTVEQFLAFRPQHPFDAKVATTDSSPVNIGLVGTTRPRFAMLLERSGRHSEDQWCLPTNWIGGI